MSPTENQHPLKKVYVSHISEERKVLDLVELEQSFFPCEYIVALTVRDCIKQEKKTIQIIDRKYIQNFEYSIEHGLINFQDIKIYQEKHKSTWCITLWGLDDDTMEIMPWGKNIKAYLNKRKQDFLKAYDILWNIQVVTEEIPDSLRSAHNYYEAIYIYSIELDRDKVESYLRDITASEIKCIEQESINYIPFIQIYHSNFKDLQADEQLDINVNDIEDIENKIDPECKMSGVKDIAIKWLFLFIMKKEYSISKVTIRLHGKWDNQTMVNYITFQGIPTSKDILETSIYIEELVWWKIEAQSLNKYTKEIHFLFNDNQEVISSEITYKLPLDILPHQIKQIYPHCTIIEEIKDWKTRSRKCIEKINFKKRNS